jgi:hypothetical protein
MMEDNREKEGKRKREKETSPSLLLSFSVLV